MGLIPDLVYSGTDGYYLPLLFINDWWTLNEHMTPVNASTPVLPLRIIYDTMGIWKFRIQSQLTTGFSMHTSMGLAEDGDMEDIKHLLTETNPYVLGGMMLVSMLHMIFDFLAFKNGTHTRCTCCPMRRHTVCRHCVLEEHQDHGRPVRPHGRLELFLPAHHFAVLDRQRHQRHGAAQFRCGSGH